jgi:hypothetical protein
MAEAGGAAEEGEVAVVARTLISEAASRSAVKALV